eukprot:m.940735 g.940735  ORF g.940735 m.940735 type:complete len:878 (-) comp23829_c0_seq6:544-3177(-)
MSKPARPRRRAAAIASYAFPAQHTASTEEIEIRLAVLASLKDVQSSAVSSRSGETKAISSPGPVKQPSKTSDSQVPAEVVRNTEPNPPPRLIEESAPISKRGSLPSNSKKKASTRTSTSASRESTKASGSQSRIGASSAQSGSTVQLTHVIQPLDINAEQLVDFLSESADDISGYFTRTKDIGLLRPKYTSKPRPVMDPSEKRTAPQAAEDGGKRRRTSRTQSTIPKCPVYRPTVEEFSEPLEYIASVREEAEKFGICKIVPPPEWKPECQVKHTPSFTFSTRRQCVNRLFSRYGPNSHFIACLREHLRTEGINLDTIPTIGSFEVDLYQLLELVHENGGLQNVIYKQKWSKIGDDLRIPRSSTRNDKLQGFYYKYLLSYDLLSDDEKMVIEGNIILAREEDTESYGFETGKTHTLQSLQKFSDELKDAWFKAKGDPETIPLHAIEKEYWRIVEEGDTHIAVCYGSDIDTTRHGSGFSTSLSDPYSKFGWNLNVLPGLEGSILKHVSGISGISMPWLYVGMLFSSFCWHNEDNYLYSINYHHFGAPKQWYGVPGFDAKKLEDAFRKHMPDEFRKRPLLLHDLVTMVSPVKLVADGIRVCQTQQLAGEFVVTFPQSYHGGFSYGFNCGEAVNFAAADWIPFGIKAIQDYAEQRRPVSLNQEQLLLNTASLETNLNTLKYTLPALEHIRKVEESGRKQLTDKGVRETSFDIFSGGQERNIGSIFQQRTSSKTSKMFSSGSNSFAIREARTETDGSTSNTANNIGVQSASSHPGQGVSHRPENVSVVNNVYSSPACEVCYHVCHTSMVIVLSENKVVNKQKYRVRCLECTIQDTKLKELALNWMSQHDGASNLLLVCRYSLEEIDELIAGVKNKLGFTRP